MHFRDHFARFLLTVVPTSGMVWCGAGGWRGFVQVRVGLQLEEEIRLVVPLDVVALILVLFVAPRRHKQLFQLKGRRDAFSGRL